jgi:hypothetical protein
VAVQLYSGGDRSDSACSATRSDGPRTFFVCSGSMNFGSTPLGGTMSKREPQIILKTASEAFASS